MEQNKIDREAIEKFKSSLLLDEKSENTVEKYIRDVSTFEKYLCGGTVSKERAISYKVYLEEKGYAPRSINSIIASLNAFFDFAELQECKIKSIKLQKQIYCPKEKELSRDEYKRLLDAAKGEGNERLNLIIQTICSTGIRVSELKFITAEAVMSGEAQVKCKGKQRCVFIIKALRKKLLEYIKKHGIKSGAVFITRTKKAVSRSNIWREMKALCKSAGVSESKVFPHNLRHLFARTFYGIEKDIAKLADILGHTSIETTRIYIMTSGEEHRRKLECMHLVI